MSKTFLDAISNIVDISDKHEFPENWTQSDLIAKLFEEGGEFSEACMIKNGKLSTKKPKTEVDDFLEAADMIICILDLLKKNNPELSKGETIYILGLALETKTTKWYEKLLKGY